jgi:hypothetical protein
VRHRRPPAVLSFASSAKSHRAAEHSGRWSAMPRLEIIVARE